MKLSVVIICWNDWKVIENCLQSIFACTHQVEFEVIVSDNGSTDGSVEKIKQQFPAVRVVENRANLGFARGNNSGIREAHGEYVLILNPDTIMHEGSLDRWMEFADRHPEAGAFGCKVHNPDGTYQESARRFQTPTRLLVAALYLRPLEYLAPEVFADQYLRWEGDTEREIDWQSGCCVMFRAEVLKQLNGFDEQFFYQYEEVDLCRRVWDAGYPIRFTPTASITHLGGQSVGRFPIRFVIEVSRNRYRYYYKHFGKQGARRCRRIMLMHFRVRLLGYGLLNLLRPRETLKNRLAMYRAAIKWNKLVDPVEFVETGAEPQIEPAPSLQTT
jgi:N-acetylglucosaminyl-diphospho-decaprenol L-rhamnosyltransferase